MSIESEEIYAEMEPAILEYYDKYLAQYMEGIPGDVQEVFRAKYVSDVQENPRALWTIAKWYFGREYNKP